MNPTITKLKNARGRIVGYRARIGDLQEIDRPTAAAAKADCLAMLDAYLRDHQRGSLTLRLFDRDMILEPCRYAPGFTYRLQGSACVHGPYVTREDAEDRAVFHCAQNAWTLETDDATFFAALPPQTVKELADLHVLEQLSDVELETFSTKGEWPERFGALGLPGPEGREP